MKNPTPFKLSFKILPSLAIVAALALLAAIPSRAQQSPGLSARYTHIALHALRAIEAAEPGDIKTSLPEAIISARSAAATDEERQVASILEQIYQRKLRDSAIVAAYQRVIEIENFQDNSDTQQIRGRKDYAAAQLTDTLAEIQNREDRCFRDMETSLSKSSLRGLSGCSALIQ